MKNLVLVLTILLSFPILVNAQSEAQEDFDFEANIPYTKNAQFGISLELSHTAPTLTQNDLSQVGLADEVNSVSSSGDFGIGLGVLYGYEMTDLLTIRVQPTLSFLKNNYEFDLNDEFDETLSRETVNIDVPLHLILENVNKKVAPSAILGARYRHNIVKNTITSQLAGNYNNNDVLLDLGAGLSFQFDNFKFKTELLYSYGLLEQVGENQPNSLASALGSSTNNQLALRFLFFM